MTSILPPDQRPKKPKRRKRTCQKCGSDHVATILWGLPEYNDKLIADLNSGKISLGGCCVTDDDPTWECNTCGHKWG